MNRLRRRKTKILLKSFSFGDRFIICNLFCLNFMFSSSRVIFFAMKKTKHGWLLFGSLCMRLFCNNNFLLSLFFVCFFFLNSFVAFALVLPNPGLSPLLSFYLAPGGLLYWCVSHSVPVRSGWTTCRRCPLPRKWGSSRDIFHPTKVIQSSRRRTALWLLVVILPECGRDPEV
jgi:hypothetical protein